MFTVDAHYSFDEIKEKFGVKKGGAILRKGKSFVALTLGMKSFIQPNVFLVGSGSLVRKVGRDLASEKKPIDIFHKGKYRGKAYIDKTITAPKAIKSKLSGYPEFNPKDYSRIVYLNFSDSQPETDVK
jgi:hypothetical protein